MFQEFIYCTHKLCYWENEKHRSIVDEFQGFSPPFQQFLCCWFTVFFLVYVFVHLWVFVYECVWYVYLCFLIFLKYIYVCALCMYLSGGCVPERAGTYMRG